MTTVERAIYRAILQLLRSLVRFLLKHHVSHKVFNELARRAYVEVAHHDFTSQDQKKSYSRVAVVTGLSRKEVVRLTQDEQQAEFSPKQAQPNRALRVINGWTTDDDFTNKKGRALELPLRGEHGSFQELVKRYSGDITAGAILDEMVRIGAVRVVEDDRVRLLNSALLPSKDISESVEILGLCVADLVETIHHNIEVDPEHPYFQRELIYHDMPPEVIAEFEKLSRKKSEALLLELGRWLAKKKKSLPPLKEGEKRERVGLGIYFVKNDHNGENNA